MPDDSGSVDSETSRLGDINEMDDTVSRNSSSTDFLSDQGNIKEAIDQSNATDIQTTNNTQEVVDSGGTVLLEATNQNPESVTNELIIGSEVSILSTDNVTEVTPSVSNDSRVPSLGLGVEGLVDECLQESCVKEGSENSRDGVMDDGELDLTGIDDIEINKVNNI